VSRRTFDDSKDEHADISSRRASAKERAQARLEGKAPPPEAKGPPRVVRRRIEAACYLFVIPTLLLTGRMVQLQAFTGASGEYAPTETFTKRQVLPARRAQVLAADGTALAVTLNEFNVCANPRAVKDKEKLARLLAECIGGDESKYLAELQKETKPNGKPNYYVRLARRVDEDRIDRLKARKGPQKRETRKSRKIRKEFWAPVSLEPTPRRHYPLGAFAPQLIGFTGNDGKGADGIEKAWNDVLAGQNGVVVSQVDSRERPVPGFVSSRKPAIDGRAVVTTIDPQIQADVDATLATLQAKFKPNFATAIVMRPATGEIVAMTTTPLFDLNNKPQNVVDLATNRCTGFAYEPGSTFKLITAAAAVENVSGWQSKQVWVDGQEKVGRHNIHDWDFWSGRNKSGHKTLSEGIRDSSNIVMWHFARDMGAGTMVDYARKFGVGEAVDLGPLPASAGYLARKSPSQWGSAQLANFSFGQGLMLTPLQLVRAVGAIANEGVMMKPQIVKELRDEQGRVLERFEPKPIRRVIAPETAREVTKMMVRVIKEGTARKYVFVPGYQAAGKTGSAQKADGPRGYVSKYISSLVGFVPAQKPEFVILVMADEPRGSHWGSEVCGPAFNDIANKAMLHLRLQKGASAPAPDPALMVRPKEGAKATVSTD
jgi:stage V sporulation protein D (sporulation-specific penicillin-binding protein)